MKETSKLSEERLETMYGRNFWKDQAQRLMKESKMNKGVNNFKDKEARTLADENRYLKSVLREL